KGFGGWLLVCKATPFLPGVSRESSGTPAPSRDQGTPVWKRQPGVARISGVAGIKKRRDQGNQGSQNHSRLRRQDRISTAMPKNVKQLAFGDEDRRTMRQGVLKLARAVKSTLGP